MAKFNKESPIYIIIFVSVVSLIAALIIATASVSLQPKQQQQIELDYQRNVLIAADIKFTTDASILSEFKNRVKTIFIDRKTGDLTSFSGDYNLNDVLNSDKYSQAIPPEEDVAGIRRVANVIQAFVIIDETGHKVDKVILPIYGSGLWSTIYAFVALETDGNTISNVVYYKQGETPGLGAEITNPRWSGQFKDKHLYENGKLVLSVVKGAEGPNQVDSVSGATLTSHGVNNSIHFWFSELGYQKFLQHLKDAGPEFLLGK